LVGEVRGISISQYHDAHRSSPLSKATPHQHPAPPFGRARRASHTNVG
jgi:hypothetical protein